MSYVCRRIFFFFFFRCAECVKLEAVSFSKSPIWSSLNFWKLLLEPTQTICLCSVTTVKLCWPSWKMMTSVFPSIAISSSSTDTQTVPFEIIKYAVCCSVSQITFFTQTFFFYGFVFEGSIIQFGIVFLHNGLVGRIACLLSK